MTTTHDMQPELQHRLRSLYIELDLLLHRHGAAMSAAEPFRVSASHDFEFRQRDPVLSLNLRGLLLPKFASVRAYEYNLFQHNVTFDQLVQQGNISLHVDKQL